MPKVGEKHFKYTKTGYAKAKKHAEETGKEVKYAMEGGMMNRKYYASGGAVYGEARKRKPTGRLNVGDIKKAQYKVARTRKPTGRLSVEDIAKALGALHPTYAAGSIAGDLASKGVSAYIKARKRKSKGRLSIEDIKRALGKSKAQNKAMGGKIQAMRKKKKEKKKGRSALAGAQAIKAGTYVGGAKGRAALAGAQAIMSGMYVGGAGRAGIVGKMKRAIQLHGQDPSRAGTVGKFRKHMQGRKTIEKILKYEKGRGKSKAQNKAKGGRVKGGSMRKAPGDWMRKFPVIGSRDWWGTSEGAKTAKKMQPKIPKPQKFPGKISKEQLKLILREGEEMRKRWGKHFPKVIGKFPIIGKPFRVLSKLKKKGKKK